MAGHIVRNGGDDLSGAAVFSGFSAKEEMTVLLRIIGTPPVCVNEYRDSVVLPATLVILRFSL